VLPFAPVQRRGLEPRTNIDLNRPWDKIWLEIAAKLKPNSTVHQQVRDQTTYVIPNKPVWGRMMTPPPAAAILVPSEPGAKTMALMDARPTESPIGMAVAANALLAELLEALVRQDVVTRMELTHIIDAARRSVNATKDNPDHASADVILATLQSRFPIV
jgi:hypothetical protein